jgi:hypothetical protein
MEVQIEAVAVRVKHRLVGRVNNASQVAPKNFAASHQALVRDQLLAALRPTAETTQDGRGTG